VAEEQAQGTPLIDPNSVKSAVQSVSVGDPATNKAGKPNASQLGPKEYCWGTGRRKTSIARVRIRPGSGKFTINGREVDAYFPSPRDRRDVRAPLVETENSDKYDVWVNIKGGGTSGQAGAVLLGLSRALCQADPDTFTKLRAAGFLTRDDREVERKKYGLRGARRSYQFSKR
jgi:small subunit ribosomal protein S9